MSTPVYSFRGGIRINEKNKLAKQPCGRFKAPQVLELPLNTPGNGECTACVSAGESILRGQMVADSVSPLGCPVFSPVSGTAGEVCLRDIPGVGKINVLVIYNDGRDLQSETMLPSDKKLSETNQTELLDFMRSRGLCDTDSGEPLHAAVSRAAGKVQRLVINCVESTAWNASRRRLLRERPSDVVNGARILMKAAGVSLCFFAVGDNDFDGANSLQPVIKSSKYMKIKICEAKYPAENTKVLIKALTHEELSPGEGPEEIGCAVFGAETCAGVYYAFALGLPQFEHRVSIWGDGCTEERNLLVPAGTKYSDLISHFAKAADGLSYVSGNPLTGYVLTDTDIPVMTGVSAFGIMSGIGRSASDCIHCGRCAAVCPAHLFPSQLAGAVKAEKTGRALRLGAEYCLGCNSCSYVCPGNTDPAAVIRSLKNAGAGFDDNKAENPAAVSDDNKAENPAVADENNNCEAPAVNGGESEV